MMYSMKNDEETLNRFRRLIIREQELVIQKQMNRKQDAEWIIPEAKKIIQNFAFNYPELLVISILLWAR